MHVGEMAILRTLRRSQDIRYSALMRAVNIDDDIFKFHLRKLIRAQYIEKLAVGTYRLTTSGKEFANTLDKTTLTIKKQPKLSLFLVISRQTSDGQTELLFQQRLRNPFYNYWGCLSGPAKWGEAFETTAQAELYKQTGLSATFFVKTFLRTTDYDEETALLEDKLFIVLEAHDSSGLLLNDWSGGCNKWMTIQELCQQPHYFKATESVLVNLDSNINYRSVKHVYRSTQY